MRLTVDITENENCYLMLFSDGETRPYGFAFEKKMIWGTREEEAANGENCWEAVWRGFSKRHIKLDANEHALYHSLLTKNGINFPEGCDMCSFEKHQQETRMAEGFING